MIFQMAALAIILPVLMIILSHTIVEKRTEKFVFNDIEDIPKNKVGLLLGTAKFVASGRNNLYYQFRIEATKALYDAGKIEKILISGDNSRNNYNEPKLMKEDLIQFGHTQKQISFSIMPDSELWIRLSGPIRFLDKVNSPSFLRNSITEEPSTLPEIKN